MRPLASSPDELLQLAREQAEPDAEESGRVLARLRAALPSADEPIEAPLASPHNTRLPAVRGSSRALRRALLGVAGAGLFAAGFWLGRASSLVSTQALAPTSIARPAATGASPASPPAVGAPSLAPPGPARAASPADDAGATTPAATDRDGRARVAAPVRPGHAAARGASPRAVPAPAADEALKEALRRLRRAQRALHENDAGRALATLDDLDRRVPLDVLGEERQMTRILALCAAGDTLEARSLARGWHTQYPGSVYATRLQGSCVVAPDSKPSSSGL